MKNSTANDDLNRPVPHLLIHAVLVEKIAFAGWPRCSMLLSTAVAIVCILLTSCATRQLHEKDYQRWWCDHNHGEVEHRLKDSTRVDCLTSEYAVEVEFAPKWAEAIGQSLYYAKETGRKPGVVVIIRNHSDERFLKRLRTVAKEQGIKIWTVRPKDLD